VLEPPATERVDDCMILRGFAIQCNEMPSVRTVHRSVDIRAGETLDALCMCSCARTGEEVQCIFNSARLIGAHRTAPRIARHAAERTETPFEIAGHPVQMLRRDHA
jgi:hypothetical protein